MRLAQARAQLRFTQNFHYAAAVLWGAPTFILSWFAHPVFTFLWLVAIVVPATRLADARE
jgi:hypothetical protein